MSPGDSTCRGIPHRGPFRSTSLTIPAAMLKRWSPGPGRTRATATPASRVEISQVAMAERVIQTETSIPGRPHRGLDIPLHGEGAPPGGPSQDATARFPPRHDTRRSKNFACASVAVVHRPALPRLASFRRCRRRACVHILEPTAPDGRTCDAGRDRKASSAQAIPAAPCANPANATGAISGRSHPHPLGYPSTSPGGDSPHATACFDRLF